jgi:hypothetical protein
MRKFLHIGITLACAISAFSQNGREAVTIDTKTGKVQLPSNASHVIDFTTSGLQILGLPFIPTGTGLIHITSGVEDAAAHLAIDADVDPAASIAQSKLNLNGTIPAGWLGTSSTTAAAGNDSRLSDQRTPLDNSVSTAKIIDANVTTAKLADKSVTYAKIQDVTTGKLLGRYTGTNGVTQEVTISTGLNLDSSTGNLTTTAGGGNVNGSSLTSGNVITGAGSSSIQDSGQAIARFEDTYQAVMVSAAGNTNSNIGNQNHSLYVTANAGSGTYTATVAIPTAGRAAGDKESAHLHFAASTNPTVELHNNTSGGTLLFTWTGDGTVTDILAECRFDGSVWYVHDAHFVW